MSTKEQDDGNVIDKEDVKKAEPPQKWNVVLINDDYTPMEFVVGLLQQHFNKTKEVATTIMLKVHNDGKAIAGTYAEDIAKTKEILATETAVKAGHPMKITAEPA